MSGPRYFTSYWRRSNWEVNPELKPVWLSGSDLFRSRNVSPGDFIYIISQENGELLLGGRMKVSRLVSRTEAMRDHRAVHRKNEVDLYGAKLWVLGEDGSGTPLKHSRCLAPEVSERLRFKSKRDRLVMDAQGRLDRQTTRHVRELTIESALFLDFIIEFTDAPSEPKAVRITNEKISSNLTYTDSGEIGRGNQFIEGAVTSVLVNRAERDPRVRDACIQHWGCSCFICGMNFASEYGQQMAGFIHVHHLTPLAELSHQVHIDPRKDLRPVCPNCHAVIHHRKPALSIDEARAAWLGKRALTS